MTLWNSEREYLQAEWDQFVENSALGRRTLDAVEGREIAIALDVGCGAGQELIPFVTGKGAIGVGIDPSVETLHVARDLLSTLGIQDNVRLVCAKAEALPLRSGCFDAVVCRGVLLYTDVAVALAELRRAARHGAIVIVQVHNLRSELDSLLGYLRTRQLREAKKVVRRIGAGVMYHVRGRQPTNSWTGSDTFFSRRLMRRELARVGLTITGEIPHGNPRTHALITTTT